MKFTAILALLAPLAACRAPGDGGFDYVRTADTIALYRQDIADVLYLAEPTTQARAYELLEAIEAVEGALRRADSASAASFADQALAIADLLAAELAPESDVRFYVALAKIALRHVQANALEDVMTPAALEASAHVPAKE